MHNKTIHIVATVFLIVSTTIQPFSALALSGSCEDAVCDRLQNCPGCGACEPKAARDRCCCCQQALVAAASHVSASHCTCGMSTPPMDRANPREQPVREVTLRIASLDFAFLDDTTRPVVRSPFIEDVFGSRADFSQRILCVWRI